MSLPYDRYDRGPSRRGGVWTHWVPLAVTLSVATAGLAAWIWSQRRDDEDDGADHDAGLDYDNADYGDNPPYGASGGDRAPPKPRRQDDQARAQAHGLAPAPSEASGTSWGARMSGALWRAPSPQHLLDSTGKTVAAGVAAAGAAVGKALASIREEDKAYAENPWSEEADAKAKQHRAPPPLDKRRRTVAVVVSADTDIAQGGDDGSHEIASILSHIPRQNDLSKIKLYILIYAPDLTESALDAITTQTPGEEAKSPLSASGHGAAFSAIYSQALTLVDKEAMILPFTTPTGYVHLLRHMQPEVLYLQESLAGEDGSVMASLQSWLRHDVILVVGAESGSGGLADSESEAEKSARAELWWQRPERVGRGRGVVVVDGMRVHDDWVRRVQGRE